MLNSDSAGVMVVTMVLMVPYITQEQTLKSKHESTYRLERSPCTKGRCTVRWLGVTGEQKCVDVWDVLPHFGRVCFESLAVFWSRLCWRKHHSTVDLRLIGMIGGVY
jgi:hypothetical protein